MLDIANLSQPGRDKNWKIIFWILAAFITVIMLILSKDYGMSGDEWVQIEYGRDVYNYFANGDPQALSYANKSLQYQSQEMYGGLFDFTTEALHRMFPSLNHIGIRHFCNALTGAVLMIFTGLLARRLAGRKWMVGILAMLFIFFSPRIFGESMNNPKDIPFACGFTIGLYAIVAFLQDFPKKVWGNTICLAIGLWMTYGIRSAGGMLLIGYYVIFIGVYYLTNTEERKQLFAENNKLLKKLSLQLIIALALGIFLGTLTWPWGLQSPISNPLTALSEMANRSVTLRVLFEGEYRPNNNMPWYYEFKWIMMTSPLIVLLADILFIILILRVKRMHGTFAIFVVLFSATFPILYMVYKHSSVHDTWRHVFFVYPAWVIMAALAIDTVAGLIKSEKLKPAAFAAALIGLLPAIVWTVRAHPNQYVYFNELQGGVKGAYGYFDIDYYQNTSKQASDWIHKNVKPIPGRKIKIMSNMAGIERYFEKDTSWIAYSYGRYRERYHLDWDYYIAYPRYVPAEQMQNDKWPAAPAAKIFEIDGVPLSAIFENKGRAGIAAYEALEKKDYVTAAQKYAEYIAANGPDENVMNEYAVALAYSNQLDAAIGVLNKAVEIDPSDPQRYQILASLYQAKGDTQSAQNAINRYNEIVLRMQELEAPAQE